MGGVIHDLGLIAKQDKDLADCALAAAARSIASELDGENSATSKSMCANALLAIMNRLWELVPAKPEDDSLDDLARRRADRKAGFAGS